jgi:DNA helicase-2/ATP-dependent DNA helicase PcrA
MKDRTDFFSNRVLLRKAVKQSNGELIDSMVKDVVTHTNHQLKESAKKRYGDYDKSKLETLDGKSLDYQTPDDVANTIDVEDFSILLEILHAKIGSLRTPKGNIKKYHHMVLDEAQELNSIELSVLKRALAENPSITIAGDAAQQVDPTSSFTTWENILNTLNQKHSHSVHLNTSYRSPKPVAEFAHKILGEIAPAQMPKIIKDGAPVSITPLSNKGHMSILLSDTLNDLQDREPGATVAVIAKTPESAEHYYKMIQDIPKVRLVLDGEFDFTNGIDVTCVKQVKGLEFDYVVIPDADAVTYPNNNEARRQLHVAATRAIHQLWVISIGTPSIIIPKEQL